MLAIRTILHPTDFSEQADHAFWMACQLAREYGARLIVVHVVPPPLAMLGGTMALPPLPEEYGLEALKERLSQVRPERPDVVIERQLVLGEAPAEIVRLARECKADLIVMGTHGRRGLGRLLMGSVAEEVVRRAPCLVLTLKNPAPGESETKAEVHEAVGV
jgi:nucleotide-binding universal stress UspA family protein